MIHAVLSLLDPRMGLGLQRLVQVSQPMYQVSWSVSYGRAGSKLALLSEGRLVNLQVCLRRRTNLKRHCLQEEQFSSKIPSIFDHRVRNSSIIQSNYQMSRFMANIFGWVATCLGQSNMVPLVPLRTTEMGPTSEMWTMKTGTTCS
jgi:hypothetical protein